MKVVVDWQAMGEPGKIHTVTFRVLVRVVGLSKDDLWHLTARSNLFSVLGSVLSAPLSLTLKQKTGI